MAFQQVSPQSAPDHIDLPTGAFPAIMRGLRARCPRCDQGALFRAWIKPVDRCSHCSHDWSVQQADDFPAYIGIFVTGHVLAPFVIALIGTFELSAWATLAIILPIAIVMTLAMLHPVKGGVIALLWWWGVGAFKQERRASPQQDDKT